LIKGTTKLASATTIGPACDLVDSPAIPVFTMTEEYIIGAKSFMRAGLTATFALISLASITKHLSAEALSATNTVAYAPIEGVSYDIGSKSMHGYFVRENGACSVILMIAEKIDPETATPVSAARIRLTLQPGEVAGLDSEEGRSLDFTCGGSAERGG
jgi:hypothetical protein